MPYSGDASFTATGKSEKEGTAEWSGAVSGDHIEGKLLWKKAGQPDYVYTFAGSEKK